MIQLMTITVVIIPTDSSENPHHLCLVSYRMPSDFVPVVAPHGNSKSLTPFFPTLPSTQKEIGNQCSTGGPKHVVSMVSKKVGGVLNAHCPGELPRNERQVTYMKQKSKMSGASTSSASDPVSEAVPSRDRRRCLLIMSG